MDLKNLFLVGWPIYHHYFFVIFLQIELLKKFNMDIMVKMAWFQTIIKNTYEMYTNEGSGIAASH